MLLWIYFRKEMKKELSRNLTPSFSPVGVTGSNQRTTRPPAVERIFVFIGIGLEISDTIPCEWDDVLYLLRLSEMKSVIKM